MATTVMAKTSAMNLCYLPANCAWVFIFGHDIRTAQITNMGDYGTFFTSRKEAVNAARECKLVVEKDGSVHGS